MIKFLRCCSGYEIEPVDIPEILQQVKMEPCPEIVCFTYGVLYIFKVSFPPVGCLQHIIIPTDTRVTVGGAVINCNPHRHSVGWSFMRSFNICAEVTEPSATISPGGIKSVHVNSEVFCLFKEICICYRIKWCSVQEITVTCRKADYEEECIANFLETDHNCSYLKVNCIN